MSMRREGEAQSDLVVTRAEMPRSPGHVFCDKLQDLLTAAGFAAFVEATCKLYYALRMGARSHCRRVTTSGCTWSAISRGLAANAASSGAVRILTRYAIS